MTEPISFIPSRVKNCAEGGHVAGAGDIIDDGSGITLDELVGNKEYVSAGFSGMGRVVLKKNIVNGVNTLTQSMMSDANTIYVIQYDFTLGENITIPANCVLEFDGGSISNGTIVGNNTIIEAGLAKIFNTDVTLGGSWNLLEVYPEWFGAVADGDTNCSPAFNAAVKLCYSKGSKDVDGLPIKLGKGTYLLDSPIILPLDQNQYQSPIDPNRIIDKDWKVGISFIGSGYMCTVIKASAQNNDSIFKSDNDADYSTIHRLKCLFLRDMTISGGFVCPTCFNSWSTLQIYINEFTNVLFTEFANIAVEVTRLGSTGQNAECNWRNVRFTYNYIGMKLNGASCSFWGCRWERNYYQGLVITKNNANLAFYEVNIQYNANIDSEYEAMFNSHGIVRGDTPANLYFDSCEYTNVVFSDSYFEPSYDNVRENNIEPIIINERNGNGYYPSITIRKSYFGMFSNFIKIIRDDGQCLIRGLDIDLKVTRFDSSAYILSKTGGNSTWFSINTSRFKITNLKGEYIDDVVLPNANYDPLDTVYIDIPQAGSTPPSFMLGIGQKFYHKTYGMMIYRRHHPYAVSNQIWVDERGNTPCLRKGTTAERPKGKGETGGVLDGAIDIGFEYFDTDLHKPIYVKEMASGGTSVTWVDATGTPV